MKTSDFSENEKMIASELTKYSVALEMDKGPPYAAKVGVIISLFALVENYSPHILRMLTGLNKQDARAIMGVFRAFSNRIDLLKAVYKPRGELSVDAVVGSHYAGLFNEANKIRNKYAHATYSIAATTMHLHTYSGDYGRTPERIIQTDEDFEGDITRMKRIICELHALVYRNEIPQSLHKQLQKLDR